MRNGDARRELSESAIDNGCRSVLESISLVNDSRCLTPAAGVPLTSVGR